MVLARNYYYYHHHYHHHHNLNYHYHHYYFPSKQKHTKHRTNSVRLAINRRVDYPMMTGCIGETYALLCIADDLVDNKPTKNEKL